MILTTNEVKKIADLAMLDLSEKEIRKYTKQLTDILKYVKILDNISVSKIVDHPHAKVQTVLRIDKITSSLTIKESLSNRLRHTQTGYFTINSVLVNNE